MTVFKMRSRRKADAHPAPLTAITAESTREGLGLGEKLPDTLPPSLPEVTEAPQPVGAGPSGSAGMHPPSGSYGSGVGGVSAQKKQVDPFRLPDGQWDVAALAAQPGHCGCCAHWEGPDAYGDGLCRLGRASHGWADGNPTLPVLTFPHTICAARTGRGWKSKGNA